MNAKLEIVKLAVESLDDADRAELLKTLAPPAPETPRSLRLFKMVEACEATGLSRATLWRAIRDGNLKAVEIRAGSKRVPENELRRFVAGRK